MKNRLIYILISVCTLAGCTSTIYQWGGYEESLYQMYIKKDVYNLHEDLAKLATEIEKTNSQDKLVPPGVYAHAGYLAYLAGDTAAARGYFQAEKQAFPESMPFMNRMLEQLK